MRRLSCLAAAVALLTACDSPNEPAPVPAAPAATATPPPEILPRPTVLPPGIPASAWQVEQAVEVDLAVHQFQFRDTRLPWPPVYFLARSSGDQRLPWTDPTDELLRRFAGHEPPVKPLSRSRVDPFSVVAVVDRETGEQGVVFQLGPRAWVSETEVHVTGGYYFNGIAANWNIYRLRYEGRRWLVVHVQREWIS